MKTYSQKHPITVNAECMVMVDQKTPSYCGGRFITGIIRDRHQQIVVVEITESSFDDFKIHEQIRFKDFQIWPLGQDVKQLNLFQ